ncbi:MAG: chromate transporter [Planctomycetes bacterium]|jgi:chromate transporter|nr:chromate transporter [Planctomycetota bacterium]
MPLLLKLYLAFLTVGVAGFGGGAASFGLMHHELVTAHELLTEKEVGDCIAMATMVPGPVAVNASALSGFAVAGLPGAAVCVIGILTPPAALIAALTMLLAKHSERDIVSRIRHALRPGALGLVIYAVYTIGKSRLDTDSSPTIMAAQLIIVVAAFALFVWKQEKIHPAFAVIAFGLLGMLIF